jgi:RHO1 GDP-GTP exchange protein 1/2
LCRPRRQYTVETCGNSTPASPSPAERPSVRGLPTDPRPAYKIQTGLRPETSSRTDARSPSPVAAHTRGTSSAQYPMPVPDTSTSIGTHGQNWSLPTVGRNYSTNGVQSSGSTLQKQPSYRPQGASAPRIPGHSSSLDPRDDASTTPSSSADLYSSTSNAGSSYFPLGATYSPNLTSLSNIPPPPPLKSPSHAQIPAPPNHALDRNSSDDILAPGTHGFARPLSHSKCPYPFFSRYLPGRPDHRSPPAVSSSERPLRSTSTVSTSSSTHMSGLERNFTMSTVATMSTAATTYSSASRDKDTIMERTPIDRGDSFSSTKPASGPVSLNERQHSEPARSETTVRSRLASEIERLKSREAMEDATNSYGDEDYYDDEEEYDSEEESLDSFVNFSLLSNIAVWLRDQVPRGTHVKGSIPYPRAFTGRDIVVCAFPHLFVPPLTRFASQSTLQSRIVSELLINQGVETTNRAIAVQVARSLQQQLFFYEVEWGGAVLQDGVEDVYMFLDDQEGSADAPRDREELPTSVITVLTRCYAPSCSDISPCYSFACPRRARVCLIRCSLCANLTWWGVTGGYDGCGRFTESRAGFA